MQEQAKTSTEKARIITEDAVQEKIKLFRQGLMEAKEQRQAYQQMIDDLDVNIGRTEGAILGLQQLLQPEQEPEVESPPVGAPAPAEEAADQG